MLRYNMEQFYIKMLCLTLIRPLLHILLTKMFPSIFKPTEEQDCIQGNGMCHFNCAVALPVGCLVTRNESRLFIAFAALAAKQPKKIMGQEMVVKTTTPMIPHCFEVSSNVVFCYCFV